MSRAGLDLSKFKKIKEDQNSAVLQHPEGHQITIAKNVLSKGMRDSLDKIPVHLAGGTPDGPIQDPTDEELSQEARNLPKGSGKAEEYQMAQNNDYHGDFPDVAQNASNNQPEQMGPAAPSSEDVYNQRVQEDLDHLKQVNVPYKLGFTNEDDLRKRAQEETLNTMSSQKKNDQEDAADQQKSNQVNAQDHYTHDVAYIKDQNTKRVAIGLSPLPLPLPPGGGAQNPNQNPNQNPGQPPQPPNQNPGQAPQTTPAALTDSKLTGSNLTQNAPSPAAPEDFYTKGMAGEKAGIQEEANALGTMGNQQASARDTYQLQMDKAMGDYQTKATAISSEIKTLAQEVKDNVINPNRVMENKSTWGKISTAIGLILSGAGSGMSGQANMAQQMLNQQITNDIDSQKSQLGSKKTLLSAYMDQLHNLDDATKMTMTAHLEMAKNKIEQIAATNQNPLVQARAKQKISEIEIQQGQYQHSIIMNQMLQNGQMPANASHLLTPEQRERSVKLPSGMLGVAASKEDAEKARNEFNQYDTVLEQIKNMQSFQTIHGTTLPFSEANIRASAMRDALSQAVRGFEGFKRFSPDLIKSLEEQIPDPGALRQGKSKVQLEEMANRFNMLKDQAANAYLMGDDKAPSASGIAPPNLGQKNKNIASAK